MYIFVKVDCKDLKQHDFPSWTIKLLEFELELNMLPFLMIAQRRLKSRVLRIRDNA